MSISIELFEIRKLFTDAVELGGQYALIKAGVTKPVISQARAYELYGRKTVEKWVKEGLIKRIKHGERNSTVNFDSMELEILSKSSNRLSYFLNLPNVDGIDKV